jgi:glycerol uptake facilitator-like aquaporin
MLLAAVVGSGIMADRLSGGNDAMTLLANTVATAAALLALILTSPHLGCARQSRRLRRRRLAGRAPLAVAAYIAAAYWFTASTSFANPVVTVARASTDTFAGIRPADVPAFVVAQAAGAATATILFRWLVPSLPRSAGQVVVPRSELSAS